ncbi:MAG: hypothetical protein H6555_05890 [Lewinellaceae bacterium]|nr:hypothetical protein [Lewinellaceae bacterium]
MKVLRNVVVFTVLTALVAPSLRAQCTSWVGTPDEMAAKEAHVLYRGIVKGKSAAELAKIDDMNFNLAFDNWKRAYAMAPAADGQRSSHFSDGVELYKALKERTTDDAKKAEYDEMILKLYDQMIECYPNEKAFGLGRKAFDMFYMPAYGYRPATAKAMKEALEKGGNDVEYIILEPLGMVVKYLFQNGEITQEEARNLIEKAQELADYNISNNERYGQYYEAAYARMEVPLQEVESDIFDCEYFKTKLLPTYQENPEDLEIIRYVYNKLKLQGCGEDDAIMLELKTKYESMASELNAQMQEEFLANNPGVAARRLYEDGKYSEAIKKYMEAIDQESDNSKKAEYYLGVASIQYRQLKAYSAARENARKAASLRSGWGRPYMLIGDMYAATSRNCGSDGYTRGLAVLAAIEKYSYARSIDDEVSSEAGRKIGLYNASIPPKDEAHMRGMTAGTKVSTGCWIGETVTLRYN